MDKNAIIYLQDEHGEFKGQKPVVEGMEASSYVFPDLQIDMNKLFAGI